MARARPRLAGGRRDAAFLSCRRFLQTMRVSGVDHPPQELVDVLRRLGPGRGRRRAAPDGAARAACRPTSGASTCRRPGLRQAGAAEAAVAADWQAPVERNRYEVALDATPPAPSCPRRVPRIARRGRGGRPVRHGVSRRPASHRCCGRAQLARGRRRPRGRAAVGAAAGAHPCRAPRRTRRSCARRFATDAIFHAIRLEPYLEATARAPPGPAPSALIGAGRARRRRRSARSSMATSARRTS